MTLRTATPPAQPRTLRVLIIDEDVERIRAVRQLLESSPRFHAHAARGAQEAESLLADGPFDVALVAARTWLDPASPLAGLLRERRPDIAVVLLLDGQPDLEAVPSLKLGAHDFLTVGQFDAAQLALRLVAAVEENRTLRRRDTMVRWLEREARTDHLTGLYNRHAFDERLRDDCAARRGTREPVTLILADLVGTRLVNQAHGHDVGDDMLRRAASAIAHSIRGGDFAARIGGDDFGVILPGADLAVGRLIARRIAQEVERRNLGEWADLVPVTLAFGVATGVDCEPADLFAAADRQLAGRHRTAAVLSLLRPGGETDGPSVA
ncbi:GGDEF domain-containing response regulator [Tepidiforma flava]|uniref:GGDEF domain-containing response regulator n=1 Tax=Tepidiforma flava TaxID=3004094 RepID=A0ABY7M484_9CHLR|nr:GGDEF domain-containing response regulator [Tepidiforma flava]WBL35341.1 GGDEF domain-containing response regulator [Tepidiforma flava]